MPVKEIIFQNSLHHALHGVLKWPDSVDRSEFPLVIVLHKFASNSDHELIVNIANFLYPYGYATLRFDFHGHGQSEGKLEENTITQEIDDVLSAISFCEELDMITPGKATLIGHGMGADVGLLAAARDERVKCLVLLSASSDLTNHLHHFSDGMLNEIKTKGYTVHHLFGRINKSFISHLQRYNPKEELKKLSIPVLFVHGSNDFSVRWESSRDLFFAANEPKQLEIIEGADHWFRDPEHRQRVLELIIEWVKHHIGG